MTPLSLPRRLRARPAAGLALAAIAAAALAACGGGATPHATTTTASSSSSTAGPLRHAAAATATPAATTMTHADAVRLLTQATFGPTDADVAHAMNIGAAAWVDEQLAMPPSGSLLARWNADNAALQALGSAASPQDVDSAFYQEALTGPDQLRQRVAFALSEIFVVSMQNLQLASTRAQSAASWMDLLEAGAFGNYRDLLQAMTLHPAMGQYLDMMSNRKEDPKTGRIPDQNFAREVMQLFSIGLVQLNPDGSPALDANGHPVPTYGAADIDGLSRVFTGFAWGGPDTSSARFNNSKTAQAPDRLVIPMQPYAQFHSLSAKTFLGRTIPASTTADPVGDLTVAMDTLAGHPNVAPFLSRQLIQRLVTSNPSPAYVSRVAAVWNDDGQGVRGDLKAVVRAILLDPEARDPATAAGPTYGKQREPVLRLTAFLRAYPTTSDSGLYLIGQTDDPGTALAQSPLRARQVFNFYRPGYVPPGGPAAQQGLVVPEMQIANEASVAGYSNFMQVVLNRGVGLRGLDGKAARNDVQVDLSGAKSLAGDASALVADTCARLIGDSVDAALETQMTDAVNSIAVPALNKGGTNQAQIDHALWNRTRLAVLLALSSPEFIAQR